MKMIFPDFKSFTWIFCCLLIVGISNELEAQRPQLPPIPDSLLPPNLKPPPISKEKPDRSGIENPVSRPSAKGTPSLFEEAILESFSEAVFVVRQDYIGEDSNGNSIVSDGKTYLGRSYGIGIALQRRLWVLRSVVTPWLNDVNKHGKENVVSNNRGATGLRQVNAKNGISERSLKAYIKDDKHLGYYEYDGSKRPAKILTKSPSGKGFLMLFWVDNSQDPETADIQSTLIEISPDWSQGGAIEESLDYYKLRNLLGGLYITLDDDGSVDDTRESSNERRGSRDKQAGSTRTNTAGNLSFVVAGLYDFSGEKDCIQRIESTEDFEKQKQPEVKEPPQRGTGRGQRNKDSNTRQRRSR